MLTPKPASYKVDTKVIIANIHRGYSDLSRHTEVDAPPPGRLEVCRERGESRETALYYSTANIIRNLILTTLTHWHLHVT